LNTGTRYLIDLPIYRLSEEEYVEARNAYIDKIMTEHPLPSTPDHPSTASKLSPQDETMRSHLWRSYGGAWQFNEIVGYLRLHLVGTQVRAEHWSVRRKRIVRTRNKTFEYMSHKLAPETDLPVEGTNAEIHAIIVRHIGSCQSLLRPRIVDMSPLQNLGGHINWQALVNGA
jgi:hypothetical protein